MMFRILKDCYQDMSNERYLQTSKADKIKIKEYVRGTNNAIITILTLSNNKKLNNSVNVIINKYVKHIIYVTSSENGAKSARACIDLLAIPNKVSNQLIKISKKIKEKNENTIQR